MTHGAPYPSAVFFCPRMSNYCHYLMLPLLINMFVGTQAEEEAAACSGCSRAGSGASAAAAERQLFRGRSGAHQGGAGGG